MGALGALKAGLHQRNRLPRQICFLEISIALGEHDTRIGSQRELTREISSPARCSMIGIRRLLPFESDKRRTTPIHKSGPAVLLSRSFTHFYLGEEYRFEDHHQSPFCALKRSLRLEVFRLARVLKKRGTTIFLSRRESGLLDWRLLDCLVDFFDRALENV